MGHPPEDLPRAEHHGRMAQPVTPARSISITGTICIGAIVTTTTRSIAIFIVVFIFTLF